MTNDKKEQIRKRLAALEFQYNGRLTAEAVVEDAKQKDSPLHDLFEWDKGKAAYQHWLDQARNIITSVRLVVTTETTTVKSVYYVRDPSAATGEQGYVSIKKLLNDVDMARDTLVAEFSRVADMLRRARELAAVLQMQDDVDKLLTGVVGIRQRIEHVSSAVM